MKVIFSYDENQVITGYGIAGCYQSTEKTGEIEISEEEFEALSNYPPIFLRYDSKTHAIVYDPLLRQTYQSQRSEVMLVNEDNDEELKLKEQVVHLENKVSRLEDLVQSLVQRLEPSQN